MVKNISVALRRNGAAGPLAGPTCAESVTMALDGVIFDLDGVLIDSNPAHVKSWLRAFRRFGYNVEADRLGMEMGKGGDKLVPNVLGERAEERRGHALRTAEKEEFVRVALEEGLRVAPGAIELLEELRRRKLKTSLATSSAMEQLEVAERASRVRWRSLMDEVVTATDVEETKPSPDLVHAAVRKLNMTPAQCAMVGDSAWDAQAASQAGVMLAGVTRGGTSAEVLFGSGARVVYQDPAELLARLDEALHRLSPGSARADAPFLDQLMSSALAEAEEGLAAGGLPVGSVVCTGDGAIIARGHHGAGGAGEVTAHGELEALRAARATRPDGEAIILVCTVEPCLMCAGAAIEAAVDTVVYGLPAPRDRATTRILPASSPDHQKPRMVGGLREKDSRALLERWQKRAERNHPERNYVGQLLAPPTR